MEALRDAGGHAEIFERAGGIRALMFHRQLHAAGPFACVRSFNERRIAFRQRDDALALRDEGKKLAKSPDAALIFDQCARFAPLPRCQQRRAIRRRHFILDIEQAAARFAPVLSRLERVAPPATCLDTLEKCGSHNLDRAASIALEFGAAQKKYKRRGNAGKRRNAEVCPGTVAPAGTPFEAQGKPALPQNLRAAIVGFEMRRASLYSVAAELRDQGVANFCGILRGNRHH